MSEVNEINPYKLYLYLIMVLIGVWLVPYTVFNWIMDPYACFGSPRIEGVNAKKTEYRQNAYLAKSCGVLRERPKGVVLGSSRADIGVDTSNKLLKSGRFYNLSLAETNIFILYRYLQHANAGGSIETAVVMLDFFMFNANRPMNVAYNDRFLARDIQSQVNRNVITTLDLVLSLDTFRAAIRTLMRQNEETVLHRRDGMVDVNTLARKKDERKQDLWTAFERNEYHYFSGHYDQYSLRGKHYDSMQIFDALLNYAYTNRINLKMAISPSHARQFETIYAKGLWEVFENWKRQLVVLNERRADQNHRTPFPIWDFSGYNSITVERIPREDGVFGQMFGYYESSHYKSAVGDLVIRRIFGSGDELRGIPDDFGIRLRSDTLEQHLETIRANRKIWRKEAPIDAGAVDGLAG